MVEQVAKLLFFGNGERREEERGKRKEERGRRIVKKNYTWMYDLFKKRGSREKIMMETKKLQIIRNVRDLTVYNMAFRVAMEIFKISGSFPNEEKYSLTDQIRRSSRSVCSNLAEGWHKRLYIAAFINKLTDSVQEASQTQTWLEFAMECGYLPRPVFEQLMDQYERIIAQLLVTEKKATTFCKPPK